MLRHYLTSALRHYRKQRLFAAINVIGLAMGLATCFLILLFVREEQGYDRFHKHADNIHRLAWHGKAAGAGQASPLLPSAMGPVLAREIPEVVEATRVAGAWGDILIETEGGSSYESGFYYADPNFFEVFSFPLQRGNPEAALTRPFTIVLTSAIAEKYFGNADPIGQTLTLNNEHVFEITGVVDELPARSHLDFNFVASYPTRAAINPRQEPSWLGFWDHTYVLLRPDAAPETVTAKLEDLVVAHMGAAFGSQGTEQGEKMAFVSQPVSSIHLHGLPVPQGDIRLLRLFSIVALLVLLIACVNYMNLSTARYADRAREVGVRKVVGAGRMQLVRQFLGESILLSLFALTLAIAAVEFALPIVNAYTGQTLNVDYLGEPILPLLFVGLSLLVGVLAGGYPALFLSSFKPAFVLKGAGIKGGGAAATLRSGLVVFQFAVSVALIIGTLVIQRQVEYVLSKPLGFSTEQTVVVPTRGHLAADYDAFKQALLQNPGILEVATSSGVPAQPSYITYRVTPDDNPQQWVTAYTVDAGFVGALGMEVVSGRDFSADFATDATSAVLVNEEAVRAFGWDEPLGKQIELSENEIMTVVGVVKDFHYQSLQESITPVFFHLVNRASRFVVMRLATNDLPGTLAFAGDVWNRVLPEWPFEYTFLDADYAALYTGEQRLARILGLFSALAITIACMGLFGLAAFTAAQRSREIGIRKVLGASAARLMLLLSTDLAKLIAVAFVVAAPIAYIAASFWLDQYAYRIAIPWGVFLAAGAGALCVALLAVSYQAATAALANPIDSLRAD